MERAHSLEFQAVRAAPVKKLPACPGVCSASVPVAERRGEEINVGFRDLRTGSGNQLRDPRARAEPLCAAAATLLALSGPAHRTVIRL